MSHKYVVFGTGRMGRAVAWHLAMDPTTKSVKLIDNNRAAVESLGQEFIDAKLGHKVSTAVVDGTEDVQALTYLLADNDVCVATCGYQAYVELTAACITAGVSMVDLGGNRDVVEAQKLLNPAAQTAGVTIIPDCGLAPGMIGILGMLAFQQVQHHKCSNIDVNMRVGGLPMNPGSYEVNPLQYSLTWSSDGLINEYEIPADELRDNQLVKVPALSGCENVSIKTPWAGKTEFEAFVTGGGSSNLPHLLKNKARNVNYKTLRYRGHCAIMKGIQQLGFFSNDIKVHNVGLRQSLTHALNTKITSVDYNDLVIARAGARGVLRNGKPCFVIYEIFCEKDELRGFSAMAQTTGYSAAIVAQMIADGSVKLPGVVDGEIAVSGERFVERLQKTGIKVIGISK